MQSGQSTPKEVKYAQYLIYAVSIIYLVMETMALVMANSGVFYVPFEPIVVCALGFFVGRSLGHLHSGTRTFVIALASLNLLGVGFAELQWSGVSHLISGKTLPPSVYSYVSTILYAAIDVLLLYYLTRPHIREAFRNPHAALSQPKASQSIPVDTQDDA